MLQCQVVVLAPVFHLSGRIETEQENDQDENDWRKVHGFSHHRQKIARARMPRRTPSNGLETANQKETSHPGSRAVEVVFILFSHEFEDRHFSKSAGFWAGLATLPIRLDAGGQGEIENGKVRTYRARVVLYFKIES